MNALTGSVARIIYSVPFAVFGLLHLIKGGKMAGIVPSWIPGGVFWVYVTGLAFLAAAVSIITQKQMRMASFGLAAMLLIFILTIHLPAVMGGGALTGLLKDTALMGAALMLAGSAEGSSAA